MVEKENQTHTEGMFSCIFTGPVSGRALHHDGKNQQRFRVILQVKTWLVLTLLHHFVDADATAIRNEAEKSVANLMLDLFDEPAVT